jgi:hypothetical protein
MYSAVKAGNGSERIDAFNRTYGLQRGLAAGLLVAAAMTLLAAPGRWPVVAALLVGTILALFRMRRFSDHYMRELVVEYLRTPAEPCSADAAAKRSAREPA